MDSFTAVLVAVLVVIVAFRSFDTAGRKEQQRAAARLRAIEEKLDALMAHHSVALPEPSYPAVEQLLREGKKIEAIKVYRQDTGADLVTAKREVEALAERHSR